MSEFGRTLPLPGRAGQGAFAGGILLTDEGVSQQMPPEGYTLEIRPKFAVIRAREANFKRLG